MFHVVFRSPMKAICIVKTQQLNDRTIIKLYKLPLAKK